MIKFKSLTELVIKVSISIVLLAAVWYTTNFLCLTDNAGEANICGTVQNSTILLTGITLVAYLLYRHFRKPNNPIATLYNPETEKKLHDIHMLGYAICIISILGFFIIYMMTSALALFGLIPGITLGALLIRYK